MLTEGRSRFAHWTRSWWFVAGAAYLVGILATFGTVLLVLWADPLLASPPQSDYARVLRLVISPRGDGWIAGGVAYTLVWIPTALCVVGTYHVLARRVRRFAPVLRCLKCDSILRELAEPQCPKCGEPI